MSETQPKRGEPGLALLVDFDDTAAAQNVAELLLERFGGDDWRNIREEFRRGKSNLRTYQEDAFAHHRGVPAGHAGVREGTGRSARRVSRSGAVLCSDWYPCGLIASNGLSLLYPCATRQARSDKGHPRLRRRIAGCAWRCGLCLPLRHGDMLGVGGPASAGYWRPTEKRDAWCCLPEMATQTRVQRDGLTLCTRGRGCWSTAGRQTFPMSRSRSSTRCLPTSGDGGCRCL